MKKQFFTNEEIKNINAAITEAEKKTVGEIIPMIVPYSAAYGWLHLAAALAGFLLASAILLFSGKTDWGYSLEKVFLIQLCGGAIALALSFIPFVRKLLIPKKVMAEQVHEAALANFISSGIVETEGRTGVLIYISLLEHRVEILADKGINSKVAENYWQAEVQALVAGIRNGKAAEALIQVVMDVGKKLEESFPGHPQNKNEIADELRHGKSY